MEFGAGNTGFMLVATALVMIMTPGLAFFYGGLVGRNNVLTIMMQSFVSLGVVGGSRKRKASLRSNKGERIR